MSTVKKKTKSAPGPTQMQLPLAMIYTRVPTGDDRRIEYSVNAPVLTDMISTKEFAALVGDLSRPVSLSTVYEWLHNGTIRADEWRRKGRKLISISVSAALRLRDTKGDDF